MEHGAVPAFFAEAACAGADPDLFFPTQGGSARPAQAVCARCPVMQECYDHALENGEHIGVWGGATETMRRKAHKGQRAPKPKPLTLVESKELTAKATPDPDRRTVYPIRPYEHAMTAREVDELASAVLGILEAIAAKVDPGSRSHAQATLRKAGVG